MNEHESDVVDLERRLVTHYRDMAPQAAPGFEGRLARALDLAPARRRFAVPRRFLAPIAAAAATIAVLAAIAIPLALRQPGPATSPTAAATATGLPLEDATAWNSNGRTATALTPNGRLWIRQFTTGGVETRVESLPVVAGAPESFPGTFTATSLHDLWLLAPDEVGSVNYSVFHDAGNGDWHRSELPGTYGSSSQSPTMSIVAFDSSHAWVFLGWNGTTTVLRTSDGAATWAISTTPGYVDRVVASEPHTLWAAGDNNQGLTRTKHPLQVSRDSGVTWTDAALPGVPAVVTGNPVFPYWLEAPPTMWTADRGAVAVTHEAEASYETLVFVTSDGGRTWVKDATLPTLLRAAPAFVSEREWFFYNNGTGSFRVASHTTDGGAHWQTVTPRGLPVHAALSGAWMADSQHGLGFVYDLGASVTTGATSQLYATNDGGASWERVLVASGKPRRSSPVMTPFAPKPAPGSPAPADLAAVRELVTKYEQANASGDYATSWSLLSGSDRNFYSSASDWAAAWRDDPAAANWTPFTIGQPMLVSLTGDGTSFWVNLGESADVSRAFAVTIEHPRMTDAAHRTEILGVVPAKDGSGWRIYWLR